MARAVAPAHPQPQPQPLPLLELNCLVRDDDPGRIFQVKIAPTETVSALREVIKEKKRPSFDAIPADNLDLWKVSIAADSISAELPRRSFVKDEAMDPLDPLSVIFPDVPTSRHLHVVIQRPQLGDSLPVPQASLQTGQQILLHHMLTETQYVGDAVSALHEYVIENEKLFRQGQYYAKFLSIVQSSGTGKTRAMLDVSS